MITDRLTQLFEFLELAPDDSFTLYAIALEYAAINNDLEAKKYFDILIETQPDYLATYYQLGKLLERLGQAEQAKATYLKGIEVANLQKNRHTAMELQQAYNQLNDEDY